MKRIITAMLLLAAVITARAIDHKGITSSRIVPGDFVLIENGKPTPLLYSPTDDKGVLRALKSLSEDFARVCGTQPLVLCSGSPTQSEASATEAGGALSRRAILVGTLQSPLVKALVKAKKLDEKQLKGKREKYLMLTVEQPMQGMDEALVIVGSDKRGTIYGIYELSEQLGVSPWYYWADTPVKKMSDASLRKGCYTAGEPAVTYRGLFLNDEAPCLTTWVKNTFGTNYGGHAFYEKVFELLLRLRANFLWPAMWSWSFYADDAQNSPLADEMGVIMGTSHHEPMARNHQEWARRRHEYGKWDYKTNKKVLDTFFREGMQRAKDTEDLITIGMRGDGDEAMGGDANYDVKKDIALLENIIDNQRRIIKEVTGRPAKERPQVWALYKEVQLYYENGLRVPDDVTILLSDDNWGDVRRLPNMEEQKRTGGWGMYYHVDYVGAPRNSKWMNVTPIQNLWEQMTLTYQYGVDKLWVLNVGDLKPMEYPITLFLDMAWNPTRYTARNLMEHPTEFCAEQLGEEHAAEAARLLNLYSKYNGRVTAEMLDRNTYDLASGEWLHVMQEYKALETDALRLLQKLPGEYHDTYFQLLLFPIQAMCNLYEMYYAQAMNHQLYQQRRLEANEWATEVERCFRRDSLLCAYYNKVMAGGKWDGMMIQKHIGYTSWNDNFPHDMLPDVFRLSEEETREDGYVFLPESPKNPVGSLSIEAAHYYRATAQQGTQWTVIPYMGRTLSGISLQPYNIAPDGATLTYAFRLPEGVSEVDVHVITKSTLAFQRSEGHRYTVGMAGGEKQEVNFNANLNENPENQYSIYYPTVARRVIEKKVHLKVSKDSDGLCLLEFTPIEPGVVLEKLVIDYGGYQTQYLFGKEARMAPIADPKPLPQPKPRIMRPRRNK